MFTDLIVLILTLIGLLVTPGRSQLWKLLLSDGILYFLVAFLVNTVPAVMLLINLNPVMNVVRSFSVSAYNPNLTAPLPHTPFSSRKNLRCSPSRLSPSPRRSRAEVLCA